MIASEDIISESIALRRYKQVMHDVIQIVFPNLTYQDIDEVIRYSINKRYKEERAEVNNNYNKKKVELSLLELTEYILDKEPIITAWGVLWKRKGTVPNPLMNMITGFMVDRGLAKDKMFTFPKGSEGYEKYMLLQLLLKLDANGTLTK